MMTGIRTTDVRDLDRQASAVAGRVIAKVTVADLDRPTPARRGTWANCCGTW